MDKEQKKLLLVAVSVGVFLLVTITVAIMILTPKVNTEETAFSSSHPVSSGRIQAPDNVVIPPPVAAIPQETTVPAAAVSNDPDRLTIQVPRPTTAAVPDTPDVAPSPPARVVAATAPAARPAATPAPAATQNAAKPAAATTTTSARTTTATRTGNDYWIQTGAYSAIVRAEDMKELLASKGFTSIIESRIVDGRNVYRVRLGPYTSEREANYWLTLVKAIDGFSDSQVRQTVRAQ